MGITIHGLDKLYKKLDKVQATNVLVEPTQRGVLRLQRRMQEYPPPPAAIQGTASRPVRFTTRSGRNVSFVAKARQPYRRTGTLGKRWTTRVTKSGSGVIGKIGNNTKYAPYVQSEKFQAKIHRGRWNTDQKIVEQERPAIMADFQQAIDRALDS